MIGGFHHNVERGVLVKQPRKWEDGTWDYPPPIGGSYSRSFVGRDGDLHIQALEYGLAIHRSVAYSGPLPGGGAEVGIAFS